MRAILNAVSHLTDSSPRASEGEFHPTGPPRLSTVDFQLLLQLVVPGRVAEQQQQQQGIFIASAIDALLSHVLLPLLLLLPAAAQLLPPLPRPAEKTSHADALLTITGLNLNSQRCKAVAAPFKPTLQDEQRQFLISVHCILRVPSMYVCMDMLHCT